jgi:hypothetical protein
MNPEIRATINNILQLTVDDIASALAKGYTAIRVYTDVAADGTFVTLDGTVTLVAGTTGYNYVDVDGTSAIYYKACCYGTVPGNGTKSSAVQGGMLTVYCTAFDVRQELAAASGQAAIDEAHDEVLWDMAVQASRLIDRYKDMAAGAYLASGSAIRYFDGTGDPDLWIDPATSVTKVEVEETDGAWTQWAATDYRSWPYNDTPTRMLQVSDRADCTKGAWMRGPRRVRVTGVWGWSTTVPALIERACRTQVARWYKRAMQGWADVGGQAEMGTLRYVQRIDPDVELILDQAEPGRSIL